MKELVQRIEFFGILCLELLFLPFLYILEEVKKAFSSDKPLTIKKLRAPIVSKTLLINIHEWGGYPDIRKKTIRRKNEFTCGLKFQLDRFNAPNLGTSRELNLSISDSHLLKDKEHLSKQVNNLLEVDNYGMDFSGYSAFYNNIKSRPNAYVILTNTSVNSIQTDFLTSYLSFMEKNPDVGLLGVSYCSKVIQSLIRNNFNAHLQSFFMLTTIEVLNEIVKSNGDKFPGHGILYKRLLIKRGEIAMSRITQRLGYNLAVTLENGSVYKFGKNNCLDNGYRRWDLKFSDVRLTLKEPNVLNELNDK
jgi:hypothetical protein